MEGDGQFHVFKPSPCISVALSVCVNTCYASSYTWLTGIILGVSV